jgi:single-stranded DNA-binding protein
MQMAHVNEVEVIGRIVGQPQKLKTASGHPFVKMRVETERFVRSADGKRSRISQQHTVVVRDMLGVPVMTEHAREGVVVRIVGELSYDHAGKAEIVVWTHLGQAKLMTFGEVASEPAPQQSQATASKPRGGLGKMANTVNEDDGSEAEARFGAGDRSSVGNDDDILSGPEFVKGDFLDDEIPF